MRISVLLKSAFVVTFCALPSYGEDANMEEARGNLKQGTALLYAKKPEEALALLERSYALVQSPNTELMIGRALRALGKNLEAYRALDHAAVDARLRVEGGRPSIFQRLKQLLRKRRSCSAFSLCWIFTLWRPKGPRFCWRGKNFLFQ